MPQLLYGYTDRLSSESIPPMPYRHRVRFAISPGKSYGYQIKSGKRLFQATFRTPENDKEKYRFAVFADTETEPESTGKKVDWSSSNKKRKYLVDQTQGLEINLQSIRNSRPDFLIIAGDLVQSGGEQRDWDEFWLRFASLVKDTAIFPLPGNHEYYSGPHKKYAQPHSEEAIAKYLSYFDLPDNGSKTCTLGRFYSFQWGPMTFIQLDSSSGGRQKSSYDTNHFLLSKDDPNGGCSPTLSPGSEQYQWLEKQLIRAQKNSAFTFVTFHHAPYSVGPHGTKEDEQSGYGLRFLTPLFRKYGVHAVFSGHDEMYEHSISEKIHFYDVGNGGDGLRAPEKGVFNPFQVFLAYKHSPEIWQQGKLIKGGRHYGHLMVDVYRENYQWFAKFTPRYLVPDIKTSGYTEHQYDDFVLIKGRKTH